MTASQLPYPPDVEVPDTPARHAKAIVAILTAVLIVTIAALDDGVVSTTELLQVILAFVTVVGVWYASENNYVKAIVAFVGAALQALIPLITNGEVTNQEWLIVLLAAIGALAVAIVPNTDPARVARFNAFIERQTTPVLPRQTQPPGASGLPPTY